RIGDAFEVWREEQLTQAAVHWVLACVFVRFIEDNGLIEEPLLAGPGARGQRAADRQTLYFRQHPTHNDRDYLYHAFQTVADLPAAAPLLDREHNPVWQLGISADAAKELLAFWRERDPATGGLVHEFTDPRWSTRFLGDLYQDLSEAAKKKYALLQTPEFVEEFILDRTLEPAIREFGLEVVRMIDPTCGSGHFLLGGFHRLLKRWQQREPGTPERALVQKALDGVYGVDLNPFAVAIARFRLLVAALQASGFTRLRDAPGYRINLAAGDSLLHGRRFGELELGVTVDTARFRHTFRAEDLPELERILGQQYHAVVGNPPYITVKDRALNQGYRERYVSCHRKYALSVPFTERFFELAVTGSDTEPAGFVGMITANSFMKREFGKKLVEGFLSDVDLTHVINTDGAYIPGHGTPTVILFGRHRAPIADLVRTVMGIKGEPSTPADPARGQVWMAILEQVDAPGSEGEFVSVVDLSRSILRKHPWSMAGGGAVDLREAIEEAAEQSLGEVGSVGIAAVSGEDEIFLLPEQFLSRRRLPGSSIGTGEQIRDWTISSDDAAFFPYMLRSNGLEVIPLSDLPAGREFLWPYRSVLQRRVFFGKLPEEAGLAWYEIRFIAQDRLRSQLLVAFAEVATHNHFVLERGRRLFPQTAPTILLRPGAAETDHLALIGLLNSSTGCFWLKQVAHNKGSTVDQRGARQRTAPFEDFYQLNGTRVGMFPITSEKPLDLATRLDTLARERQSHLPDALVEQLPMSRTDLNRHRAEAERRLRQMIALQEELDWRCYRLYGVTEQDLCYRGAAGQQLDPPKLALGERAFEIVLARRMAAREEETTWFERHGSTPITEVPAHWPEEYRELVERRIALIEQDRYVGLVERPEYKRRWNVEGWEQQEKRALRGWLLDRLESERYWPEPRLQSTRELAARAQTDREWMQVAELYVGHAGFNLHPLVRELVEGAAVPFLPVLRYKPSGLRKREVWERTWELQRREDALDAQVAAALQPLGGESDAQYRERLAREQRRRRAQEVGEIPRPPKYTSADFLDTTFWRLRGALDVPKERFISYPFCVRDADDSLVVGWAGRNHLQQAQALASWYMEAVEQEGWGAERLQPLLAGLDELIPWLEQWHNEVDPAYNERLGDFYATFLESELHRHGLTREALRSWTPPARARGRGRRGVG
ncbi:MAG: BREX-2 system adenine-specific DNA-methyltransferase PglX, partial [Gemmatimonadetes bacterium]|nr:BREX-2 system adenine-specific DNA-methyltransferase PglX [Gemmatimonadota bacterium]